MFVSCLFLMLFASIGFSEAQTVIRPYESYDRDYSDDYLLYDDDKEGSAEEGKRVFVSFLKYLLGLTTNKNTRTVTFIPARRPPPRPSNALPPRPSRPQKPLPPSAPKEEPRYRAEDDDAVMRDKILEQLDAAHRIYARLEEHASGN